MEELYVVTEYNERGRSHGYLRHIVYLEASALIGGRLNSHRCLAENLVEHTGSDSGVRLSVYLLYLIEERIYTLTCESGNVGYGSIGHIS